MYYISSLVYFKEAAGGLLAALLVNVLQVKSCVSKQRILQEKNIPLCNSLLVIVSLTGYMLML